MELAEDRVVFDISIGIFFFIMLNDEKNFPSLKVFSLSETSPFIRKKYNAKINFYDFLREI